MPYLEDISQWHVLIVDDESQMLDLIEVAFKKRNIPTLKANSAEEALETLAKTESISLILADLSMPGMDGWELLKVVQAQDKALPVVALSAFAMSDAKARIIEAGFAGFIAKPVQILTLVDDIAKQLTNRAAN